MTISEYFENYYDVVCHGDLSTLDHLFHTESPFLAGVKSHYRTARQHLEMTIDILSIELVAKQNDLLVIRDRITLRGKQGEKVITRQSENLHVMTRKANCEWKVHSTACLNPGV